MFHLPWFCGLAGGHPELAYYFFASQGETLFYLDPHVTRTMENVECWWKEEMQAGMSAYYAKEQSKFAEILEAMEKREQMEEEQHLQRQQMRSTLRRTLTQVRQKQLLEHKQKSPAAHRPRVGDGDSEEDDDLLPGLMLMSEEEEEEEDEPVDRVSSARH
jgi:hypothetical protein